MEDKLVTLAILTYSKAQILKTVLENEDIEVFIHNVNQIQPVVSSGVRVRIRESDLPKALKITESAAWLSETVVGESLPEEDQNNFILIPVDFSDYSLQACEFGFNLAHKFGSEVVILHVYYTPMYVSSLPYGDIFNYMPENEESIKAVMQNVQEQTDQLTTTIYEKIESGVLPKVNFCCKLREGIPEEEILKYAKNKSPRMIVMGTRGGSHKEMDLIGSVTAEVIERSRIPVLAIPEDTPFKSFEDVRNIAFLTNFNERDLIAFNSMNNMLRPFNYLVSLIHLTDNDDTWDEIKLAGIKEYIKKHYPQVEVKYDMVRNDDVLSNLQNYINDNAINVIALTTYKRNLFSRLFNPGMARKMVFHSSTPLLILK